MSNKLFGTDGVRGVANLYPMTAEFAFDLAQILSTLACTEKKTVAIGKDTRISGDMLEAALSAGFTANGIDVILLGVVPTPLLTLKTPSLGVDMSLMITASHNPYQDNGIKLIDKNGDKFPDEFYAEVEGLLEQNNKSGINKNKNEGNNKSLQSPSPLGRIHRNDSVVSEYIADMQQIVPQASSLKGLPLILDCANGAYSYILPKLFEDLGADVVAINNTPDGYNINKNCGSQHIEQLSQTVQEKHAHFGVAVDGDGDRIILVDDKGEVIDGDQLICFLAHYLDARNMLPNKAVVTTEWSNLGLGNYLKANGFNYFSSKVGERYVIDLMKEKHALLGGEVVGHIVLASYAKTGDAAATAVVLALAYLADGRKMSEIFPMFEAYPCLIENIRFSTKEYMLESVEHEDVKQALAESKELLGSDSTLIARKSGTEPVIKLRVEAKDEALVQQVSAHLKELISAYQK